MKRKFLILVAVLAVACWAPYAFGDTIVTRDFTASSPGFAAEANFSLNATTDVLTITLTNTLGNDTPDLAHTLYGLFWKGGDTSLSLTNTALSPGSVVWLQGSTAVSQAVNGQWGFGTGFPLPSGTPYSGVAAAGFGFTFVPNPDGVGYGLIASGYNGGGPQTNDGVYNDFHIQTGVVMTLTGYNAFDNLDNISDMAFQYGTSLSEPRIVPIPPTALLLGGGLLGLCLLGYRRKKR